MSATRWLVRLQAVDAILDQWDSLKLHFQMMDSNKGTKERCYTASQLYSMYSAPENKLYLSFVSSTLKGVVGLNKLFQSNAVDPIKLFRDLNDAIYPILQAIVVPSQLAKISHYDLATFDLKDFCMHVDCINFGYAFNSLAVNVQRDSVAQIKDRCKTFMIALVSQLQSRVPENIKILEEISIFSPQTALSQVKPSITSIAENFKLSLCRDSDETEKEWNILHRAEIVDRKSTEKFWVEVQGLKDAGGNRKFGNVLNLVLGLLSLPFWNASVERTFSIVNIVKDKLQNIMSVKMVEAMLHVRCTLDVDCYKFTPTASMIKRFNSETVYEMKNANDDEVLDTLPSE